MPIDTAVYRRIANGLASRRKYAAFPGNLPLKKEHDRIQNTLDSYIDYFRKSANAYENTENHLMYKSGQSFSYLKDGTFRFYHQEDWNALAQLTKKEKNTHLSIGAEYSFKEAGAVYRDELLDAGIQAHLGNIQAKGSCELGLWKEEEFDPRLELSLQAQASLLSLQGQAKIGTKNMYLQARGDVDVGSVYAQATCIFNKEEQNLEASIGAAAVQGEASIAFHLFGAKVTVSVQGSLGSAEANLTYRHANKEWEFGSKLGFIAGLGFKIKVSY